MTRDLERLATVVVSPRERFGSVVGSLESLFATVPAGVPVVVVEGGTPQPVRARLAALAAARPFDVVRRDDMLLPNVARNLGAARATTPYVVFADNDVVYEPGWLEALVENAEREGADLVAPITCIGPPRAAVIHHAGGTLHASESEGRTVLREEHRLSGSRLAEFREADAPMRNEVCEFHCCLARRDLLDRIGGLDERLTTREHMDLALRCRALGARVTFERRSVVTYMATERFDAVDLRYHVFRWADALAVQSMDAFETTWGLPPEREYVRHEWIGKHRARAVASLHPVWRRLLGRRAFDRWFTARYEASVAAEVEAARARAAALPPRPAGSTARALFGLDSARRRA